MTIAGPHVRRILVLQHAASEPPGLIADALAERGVATDIVRLDEGQSVPRTVGAAAGIVVMGGPMGVYESDRYPHVPQEQRLLEAAMKERVPVIGICLGSQLIASVLGARVTKGARKEIGWRPVWLEDAAATDRLFGGIASPLVALHWHGDVFELPSGAVALARSELTRIQAFHDTASGAYGLLFHLEVTAGHVEAMAREFAEELRGEAIAPEVLIDDTRRHARAAADAARTVFGRWADDVARRAGS